MDYCSSCRRHLNGALVCPGCGAYAPDIAPVTAGGRTVPAPAAEATAGPAALEVTASDPPRDDGSAGPADDLDGVPPAPQGRAARRRQLARWKKNQRRAVVATAVALVGGGLTVSAMDRHSAGRAQAATSPEVPSTPAAEQPTSQHTRPAVTRPGAHRSSPTPPSQSPATGLPREQNTPAAPRTTPPAARPDATASPDTARTTRTTATSAPQQRSASSSSPGTAADDTGTAAQQTTAPAAADDTNSGTPRTSPSPAATSPSQVCLLVVCLG
ncbi:hypothetical protein [Streptomyces sp. NPDC051636]|uniref:SCO2400 family protein n=1 Tax=Streptomyces sp. NPDC051636 TaxID=3365663 RepID=UPI0037986B69